MNASQLLLFVQYVDVADCAQLLFYLEPDSRPNYPDEVPESDAPLVEIFEFLPYPSSIKLVNDHVLMVFFDDEANAEPREVCAAIGLIKPEKLLSWESIEGEVIYQQWQGADNTLIYAPLGLDDPDDDLKYNRNLDELMRKRVDALQEKPEEALQLLADIL